MINNKDINQVGLQNIGRTNLSKKIKTNKNNNERKEIILEILKNFKFPNTKNEIIRFVKFYTIDNVIIEKLKELEDRKYYNINEIIKLF